MTANENFFETKKPAAVFKHHLIKSYVYQFATMVTSKTKKPIWVIDAFAGPGEYAKDDFSEASPGSPRILCELSNQLEKRNTILNCVFIEKEKKHFQNLKELVNTYSNNPSNHTVLHGDSSDHLAECVKKAGDDTVLIILDPFGINISYEELASAIKNRPEGATTEILLNYSLTGVWRVGGLLNKTELNPTELKTLEHADRFFGGDYWREDFQKARKSSDNFSAAEAAANVELSYRMKVLNDFGFNSVNIPVRKRPNQQPIFNLTLFYNHQNALYVFCDAAGEANTKWRALNKKLDYFSDVKKNEDSLFSDDDWRSVSESDIKAAEAVLDKELVNNIKQNISNLLDKNPSGVKVIDFIADLYGAVIGVATEKHIRKAWDSLSSEGFAVKRDTTSRLKYQTIRKIRR